MRKIDTTARYDTDLNNWVRQEENLFIIGLTDFAQEFVGQITSITDFPKVGQTLPKGSVYCLLESDKATTEVYLPISGQVVAINEALLTQPELINEDCYGTGWVVKIRSTTMKDWEDLQNSDLYAVAIGSFFNK